MMRPRQAASGIDRSRQVCRVGGKKGVSRSMAEVKPLPAVADDGIIRPIQPTDLDRVLAVERLCHANPWSRDMFREEMENPLSTIDLLWLEGHLAGFLCSWMVGGELHIMNVATAPPFRRRGVAARLLAHVLERGTGRGLEQAFLEVRAGNEGAMALYRRFGFRPVGRRPRYYPDGEDAVVMELAAGSKEPEE